MRCARRARVAGPRPAPANAAARPAQASLFVFELLTRRRPLRRHAPKAYVHGMRMLIPSHFFVASCEGRKPCERAGLARVREGVRESRATRIPALPDFFGPRGENLAKRRRAISGMLHAPPTLAPAAPAVASQIRGRRDSGPWRGSRCRRLGPAAKLASGRRQIRVSWGRARLRPQRHALWPAGGDSA